MTTLLLAFSLATMSNYLGWQARWVKDRSLIVNLGELAGAKEYSVYWVDDQYPLGGEASYDVYEWSGIFSQAWGGESRIGFREDPSMTELLAKYNPQKDYNLSGFDPAGCQAILMISQATSIRSEVKLVRRYFYFKFLRPQEMQHFLVGVARVQVQSLPSPLALNCKQR